MSSPSFVPRGTSASQVTQRRAEFENSDHGRERRTLHLGLVPSVWTAAMRSPHPSGPSSRHPAPPHRTPRSGQCSIPRTRYARGRAPHQHHRAPQRQPLADGRWQRSRWGHRDQQRRGVRICCQNFGPVRAGGQHVHQRGQTCCWGCTRRRRNSRDQSHRRGAARGHGASVRWTPSPQCWWSLQQCYGVRSVSLQCDRAQFYFVPVITSGQLSGLKPRNQGC